MLLEAEWVLRYSCEIAPDDILGALRRLLAYRNLQVENRSEVLQALALFEAGLDSADALPLASSADAGRFATFDRALSRQAARGNAEELPRIELLAAKTR